MARVQLPYLGGSSSTDPGTPFPDEYAVSGDAIWFVYGLDAHLMRLDLTQNRLTAITPLEWRVALDASEDIIWAFGPYGYAPGPEVSEVLRLRPRSGELEPIASVRGGGQLLATAGSLWVSGDGGWWRLNPVSGQRIVLIESRIYDMFEACGGLWGRDDTDRLLQLDPTDLSIVASYATETGRPIGNAQRCWILDDAGLRGVGQSDGVDSATPIIGELVTTEGMIWLVRGRVIQAFDPERAEGVGPRWELAQDDVLPNAKGDPDWRLLAAGGSLWLLNKDQVIRLDIPA